MTFNRLGEFIYKLSLFSSIVITTVLVMLVRDDQYRIMFLLPLAFSVSIMFCKRRYYETKNNVACVLILSLYFIRFSIYPLFLYLSNYSLAIEAIENNDIYNAIFLEIIEILAVTLAISIKPRRRVRRISIIIYHHVAEHFSVLLGLICFLIWMVYPQFGKSVTFFFNINAVTNIDLTTKALTNNLSGIRSVFFTLFTVFLRISCVCIPLTIMKKASLNSKPFTKVLMLITTVIPLFFVTESTMYAVVTVLALVLCYIKLFGDRSTKYLALLAIPCVLGIIHLIMGRLSAWFISTQSNDVTLISRFLQSYFNGFTSIAAGFKLKGNYFSHLFYDIYYTIPFRSTLFGVSGDQRLTILFNKINGVSAQVIPCITQGYFYFSALGILLPMFFVRVSINAENKMHSARNLYEYASYTMLMCFTALTPVMYNFTIWGATFLNAILPIMIIGTIGGNDLNRRDIKSEQRKIEEKCDIA